ncbi:MAG: transposase, partial [Terriglobia bacterium]
MRLSGCERKTAMNLIDVTKEFATEEACLAYLEAMRWPKGIECVHCGSKKISKITRKKQSKNRRSKLY